MILFYNIAVLLGILALAPFLLPVLLASHKRRKTLFRRLGVSALPQIGKTAARKSPTTRPIWVHALSVGEVISAVPLIKAMARAYPSRQIVFSASTVTGFEVAKIRLGQDVFEIFYYPYDLFFSVRRVADAVDPALVVIVESDIWPNFLEEMKNRAVPMILVNARLSNRSFRGYSRFKVFAVRMFMKLKRICTQTQTDADRFCQLGISAERVVRTGNIKFDQIKRGDEPDREKRLATLMGGRRERPILVAGSTHEGEEAVLLDAYSILRRQFPGLMMVVAPRDPGRARSVCRICKVCGYTAALVGTGMRAKTEMGVDVAVVDTLGDLATLYGLSDVAFVGGSLVHEGGHNPLEPAALSKPVLFGPDMSDFLKISEMLITGGGAFQVTDAHSLARRAADVLGNRDRKQRIGLNALAVYRKNSGAVEKTLKEIKRILQA